MRLSKKLAFGAAAGVVPFLVVQTPAAAATAEDREDKVVTYTATGGATMDCALTAAHVVDTDTGDLSVVLVTAGCRGGLSITASYRDLSGASDLSSANTQGTEVLDMTEFNVGSTAVTVDYEVNISDCSANCDHTLQTKTK
jgi:hypothetical protein